MPETTLIPEIMELRNVLIPDECVTLTYRVMAGDYHWKNDSINGKYFRLTLPAGPRSLVLAHFNKLMNSEQVEQWTAENGYEVALIDDLLAVGSHPDHRELQRQFLIIQLGSSAEVYSYRYVPCLEGHPSGRLLDLHSYVGRDWSRKCRFLLARKS